MNKIEGPIVTFAQEPLIPKVTLDPFSAAAIFTLYNVLYEKDRFGVSAHTIIHQPSAILCTVPVFGEVNSQTFSRKYYQSSREEASDFVIAIIEAISAYIKYESFRKMLPDLKNGLVRYAKSYGPISDIASTTFKLAIDRTEEAITWQGKPEEFQAKHRDEFPIQLHQNSVKLYDHWHEDDIAHIVNGISIAIQKHNSKKDCEAELTSTFKYLEIKQNKITSTLEAKQKLLHNEK